MVLRFIVVGHPRELIRNYFINAMPKDPIMQYAASKY
jgi:hypothetical protein